MNIHRTSVYLLGVAVLGLIVLGLVMLSSTSAYAPESHGSATFLLKRQVVWLAAGLVIAAIAAGVDYHFWQKSWWLWFGMSVVMLAAAARFDWLMSSPYRSAAAPTRTIS